MKIALIRYTVNGGNYILGAYPEKEYAEAALKEIMQLISEYERIEYNFNNSPESDSEESEQIFAQNIQPQMDKIQQTLRNLISNMSDQSKNQQNEHLIDPYGFLYPILRVGGRYIEIDEIELQTPTMQERKLREGKIRIKING